MSILNKSIKFSDTPIFQKTFKLEANTYEKIADLSLKNFCELKKIIDNDPFFEKRNETKLDNFLGLAAACIRLAVTEGAEFSLYTDGKNNAVIYLVAENFYFDTLSLLALNKTALLALSIAISGSAEKCIISFDFDFSKEISSVTELIK